MTPAVKQSIKEFFSVGLDALNELVGNLGEDYYDEAVKLISSLAETGGRLHITGIGKPAHVAAYMASLFSSTGTPAYFLHGTEAVHGSCGQLRRGDVVICISNSGETAEMKATVQAIQKNKCTIIGVSKKPDSWLAQHADTHLVVGVAQEGDTLNRAPRTSVLAEMLVLQGLSIALQAQRGLTPEEYVLWHPGGELGKLE